MKAPLTLTARLLAVVITLTALTVALIATATALVTRASLLNELDHKVSATVDRFVAGGPGEGVGLDRRESAGTLVAFFPPTESVSGPTAQGLVVGEGDEWGTTTELDDDQLSAVAEALEAEGPVTVRVAGLGRYRVEAATARNGTAVAGLSQSEADRTISNLVQLEILAALLGVGLAGGLGAVVVRRQLAPLREVAATAHRAKDLDLATGAVVLDERVPEHLTDTRTEVGQVGAALNALLAHVESSLSAREASERQVRQFVADASHELRTPLATIAGYTELAQRQPEAVAQSLDRVRTESARMAGLVDDLLLLARLDAGRPLASEPVDLSHLLVETVNDARMLAGEHEWRLVLPPEPVQAVGDADRLRQVAVNLLTNARLHTPAGSTVTVTVLPDGFSVQDDGPGFAPDLVAHAFDRFTRGDQSRARDGDRTGTGLGLSVVQAIVAAHGGRVDLSSAPGDTTVRVTLPTVSPPRPPRP